MESECYINKCYTKRSNMIFLEYQKDIKDDQKNYAIIYKCKYCNDEYAKLMTDKNDPDPNWLPVVDSDKCYSRIPNRFL